MNPKPESQLRGIHADHFDLAGARSWMSNICGPHQLVASRPGRIQFRHSASVLRSMSTTLGIIEYGTDVTVGIADPDSFNSFSISLPLSGEQELLKAGERLHSDREYGLIVAPNESQELNITGDCRKLQVVISRAAMHKTLEDMLQRPLHEALRFSARMDAVNGATASWWRMARHFIDEMELGDLYSQPLFSRDLESALVKGLILSQPNNYSAQLRENLEVRLPHYLIRARDYIHAHARDELHLEHIEAASGVSRFKLFEAFRRHFELSPMAYLKKYRLSAVRQELLESRASRNISVIAMEWGFSHLGRFSSEYRKLFNETPTMTRQRVEQQRFGAH
ncbi:AraC family transcriptional regulator [Pseudomonas sp. 21LCFQ02]|uniref:AraC family transcriptional regulator n=1 Tax=Pseudomonas sp. 21LCFQ02 TaxID=2957505 RepID=UPI00209BAAFF|nr:AraC family transcriptional regulator [Pseudomonas sp. 21LCFQ02]MCO8169898.1 AraC family transcriptional regulator [Pseudomonas sp. 21LCFQ02]